MGKRGGLTGLSFENNDKLLWLIKGTVARDFLHPVFSTNRPHIVPEFPT
jgi:hypothetical protein